MPNKLKTMLLTSALAVVIAAPAMASGSFTLEGLALTRDDFENDRLFRDPPRPDGLLSQVDTEWTGGARATYENDFWGHTWQLSAFFVTPQKSKKQFGAPGATLDYDAEYTFGDNLNSASNSTSAEIMSVNTQWETWGAEFNWVKNMYGVDALVGLRYINFRDNLRTIAYDETDDFLGTDNDIDRVGINVHNNLVGLQVGIRGDWKLADRLSIGGELKGGIAANFVTRARSFRSDDNVLNTRNDSTDDTGFAQFVEFNPKMTYKLNDSASVVVGGSVLWLNDVSQAGSHYATAGLSTDRTTRDNSDVLLYGASVGLKIALN